MSELRADTITASDGSSPVTLTKQSATKAWVNFTGTGTIAISESFNVTSLTDNSVGRYSANYVNNMNTATYATQVCSDANTSNDAFNRTAIGSTTTSNAFLMHFEAGSSQDTDLMIGTINGDLA